MPNQIPADDVIARFDCDSGHTVLWDLTEWAARGTPICHKCGQQMKLSSHVIVNVYDLPTHRHSRLSDTQCYRHSSIVE